MRRLLATHAPAATILIRIVVGGIFLTEGIQKFLYPADLGAGRFAKIGLPMPDMMGPFVGGVETIGGALIILGLLTRIAAIALLIDISVAILSTKIPILLGEGFWGFSLTKLPRYGFLSMLHEARTDLAMWFGLLFLLLVGAGRKWSGMLHSPRRLAIRARCHNSGTLSLHRCYRAWLSVFVFRERRRRKAQMIRKGRVMHRSGPVRPRRHRLRSLPRSLTVLFTSMGLTSR